MAGGSSHHQVFTFFSGGLLWKLSVLTVAMFARSTQTTKTRGSPALRQSSWSCTASEGSRGVRQRMVDRPSV